jgi:hypothetical protein
VSATIIYYVVVLFTEISILASEASRRKLAAAGTAWKKSGLLSSQAGRSSPTFDPGQVTNAMNPTFLKVAAAGEEGSDQSIKDMAAAIQSTAEPPSRQLWATFQASMAGMLTTIAATNEQLHALIAEKDALEVANQLAANSLALGTAGGADRAARVQRKEFKAASPRVPRGGDGAGEDDAGDAASSPNPVRAARAGALSGGSGGGGRGLASARSPTASSSPLDSPNPLRAASSGGGGGGGGGSPSHVAMLQGYRSKRA